MESGEKIPKSQRPSFLYRIPCSHKLSFSISCNKGDIRRGPAAFIVHLLAYLFDTRLDFFDWQMDGRIPTNSPLYIHFSHKTLEHFLSHSFRFWNVLDSDCCKNLMVNILYMHSRAHLYEWDWEKFTVAYFVLDGIYKLSDILYGKPKNRSASFLKKARHKDRIITLCEYYDLAFDQTIIAEIVNLRNNLFHETLWDNSRPCSKSGESGVRNSRNIIKLNQRLIPALIGYQNSFIQSKWWKFGITFPFEKDKR